MISRNQIKHLQSLRMGKFRAEHGEFTAEGIKLVDDLLGSRFTIRNIYATSSWFDSHTDVINKKDIIFQDITEDELKRISNLATPNEVVAIASIPGESLPDNGSMGKLVLILDRIQDPGNLGTIIRTADWFGISHIFCSEGTADLYNPKVVQSTMGSICRVHVHYTDLKRLMAEMQGTRHLYGAFASGGNVYEADLKFPAVLMIGNESQGIAEDYIPLLKEKIGIPAAASGAESLNASVAAGILCSEFMRRA